MQGYITITRPVVDESQPTPAPVLTVVESDTVPTLEKMQAVVGGLIEPAFTWDSPSGKNRAITGYVNEEGLIYQLPQYIMVIHVAGTGPRAVSGPMIIIGLDDSTGETVILNDEELALIQSRTLVGMGIDRYTADLFSTMILSAPEVETDESDYDYPEMDIEEDGDESNY